MTAEREGSGAGRRRLGTVLVVEADAEARERVASSLDRAGYELLECPGPLGPEYTCVGARGGRCPLAAGADLIVLNLHLAGDAVMEGTPGWQLLLYYLSLDKRVLALAGDQDPVELLAGEEFSVLRRPASPESVAAEAAELLG